MRGRGELRGLWINRGGRGVESWCALVLLAFLSPVLADEGSARGTQREGEEFFERNVRPVLAAYCIRCHGAEEQNGKVRLDGREFILGLKGTKPVVVPGKPEESLLWRAVRHLGEVRMPPGGQLPDQAIFALEQWIAAGAIWPSSQTPIRRSESYGALRGEHWAFRPVERPELPEPSQQQWARTPVDLFILQRLEQAGLSPSPEADRRTLIRRLYFDLLGLPPTPEEVQQFFLDSAPDAYERLVDRLLNSPRYGERWGRHWLDVARYADTRGYVFDQEIRYPFSYTYRDYVIRSWNEDKPYDRFVMEQLAADLLPDRDDLGDLAGLGFLTVGRRFSNNIHDIIDDRIDVVTRGLMALTVSCARCHDHKYDPVTMKDYYALYGVFASTTEPAELPVIGGPEDPLQYQSYLAELEKRKKELQDFFGAERQKLLDSLRKRTTDYLVAAIRKTDGIHLPEDTYLSFDHEELRPRVVEAWRGFLEPRLKPEDPIFGPLAVALRQDLQQLRQLLEAGGSLPSTWNPLLVRSLTNPFPQDLVGLLRVYGQLLVQAYQKAAAEAFAEPGLEELASVLREGTGPLTFDDQTVTLLVQRAAQNRLTELRSRLEEWMVTGKGGPPRAMVLTDLPRPVTPRIFERGDPRRPGEPVERRFLEILSHGTPEPFQHGSGRLELARAIVDPANPLTARVIVNRIWMWHFGRPLAEPVDDFGLRSSPPTHPELLDWLAHYLVATGWSMKELHRVLVLSSTYRQASQDRPEARAVDPENRLWWRWDPKRLEFEPMRDSMLFVAGALDLTMGGRPVSLFTNPAPRRRSVYGFIDRQDLPLVLRVFDFANPDTSTPRRSFTTVPQQALYFLNSEFVIEQAQRLVERPEIAAAGEASEKARRLFAILFQREPADAEVEFVVRTHRELRELPGDPGAKGSEADRDQRAWIAVAQALLCSNEFVFVD
jgi:mono/diheme cytochrome c family protein